jgi:putative ABC transport system permease protein
MHPREIFSLSYDALTDRKVRSILTILMVVVGSSLMVGLNGLSAGQSAFVGQQLNQLADNVLFVGSGQQNFRSDTPPASIIINSVMVSKIKSLPYVQDVIPEYTGSVSINSQGNTLRSSVVALDPQKLTVIVPNVQFVAGSSIRPNDRSALIVGDSIANPPGSTAPLISLGQTVKVTFSFTDSNGKSQKESRTYVVSAIMNPTGYNQYDRAVIINEDSGNALFHKSGKFDALVVAAQSSDYVDTVQQEISGTYGSTLGVTTPKAIIAIRQNFTNGNSSFILSIGVIALIVGAVGIVTTLYTSVTERIREIGTMKAIGAQNSNILALFLVEAVLIGILGATVGSLAGIGAGYALSSISSMPGVGFARITPIFLPMDMVKVWVLSVALSIGAGLFPAWKASKMSPMVALRRE